MRRKLHIFILLAFVFGFSIVSAITTQSMSRIYPKSFTPKTNANEITILTPANKTYTAPDSGYFPAVLGFENQLSGVMPRDWIIHQSSGAGYLRTIDELDGHKKVLDFYSGSNVDYCYYKRSLIEDVTIGSIEFWFQTTDVYPSPWYIGFSLSDGFTLDERNIRLGILNGTLSFNNGTDYILVDSINPNQWYHARIDFNMITDTSTIYLNDVLKLSNEDNYGDGSKINAIHIQNHLDVSNTHTYVDAIGYSWDPNYDIGDNLNEGLLLSYKNNTNLDWQGYSLDGQVNKTRLGNSTIPMPSPGLHSIQIFGNDSLGTSYQSSIRYFSISLINIITPENITYTQPMSGYYPGTYGFENDPSSTPPQGLISTAGSGTSIEVIDQLDGHDKIARLYDGASGGTNYANLSHTFSPQPTGVVEFWFRRSGVEEIICIELWNETLYCLSIYSQNRGSGLAFEYYNGTDYVTIISHNSDQWYHHRLDFNCTSGTFDWYIDGVLRGDDLLLRDPTPYFLRFTVRTRGWGSTGYNAYIDGIGTSWDRDYNVGDNFNEGLLLSYDTNKDFNWTGYSLDGQTNRTVLGNKTIPMPNYGLHTIQVFGNDSLGTMYQSVLRYFSVSPINIISPENKTYTQPMNGYYPATYGFESDLINGHPSDWSIMEGGGCAVNIVSEIGGHKNVVDLYDNGVGTLNRAEINNTFSDKTTGTIEFWFMRNAPTEYIVWRLWDGYTVATNIGSEGGYFVFQNDTWNDISPCNNDQWYHIKIDFSTVTDSFNLTINGIQELTNGAFINDVNNINTLQLYTRGWGTSNYRGYFDAVGYSWDPGYNIGDNLNEGLLLSYDKITTLDWQGYSYDGQTNRTILGNTTIPMPSNGLHTIQVFGNNSLGKMYQSPIRYFSVSPINILTPENRTYTEPMSGYYPATHGFEICENGELPNDWFFVPHHGFGEAYVIETFDGHRKVLKIEDTSTSAYPEAFQEFSPQTIGTIELYLRKESGSSGYYLNFYSNSSVIAFTIKMDQNNNGKFEVSLGSDFTEFATGKYSDQKWFHFRIDFDTFQDEATIYLDGINVVEIEFSNFVDDISKIRLGANYAYTGEFYADAIGYSWDPDYFIGDNLNEGLLISFENRTNLDWIGYSLDGQNNKTILGQTTIPFLTNGLHSLVLTANNTSGTFFRSNLVYFTVLTSGPTISTTSPSPNQYFGIIAPSFNVDIQGINLEKFWYSLDNGITNISFSSYSEGISQSEWNKFPHGSVQLTFYVNDSFGRIGHDTIVVYKDLNAPATLLEYTLSNPPNEVNGSTRFTFNVADDGSGVAITEYKINDGSWTTYTGAFTLTGFDQGTCTITYRSVDLVGNIESEQFLNVELVIPPPEPPEPPDLSFLLYIIIIGAVIATIGVLYFKVIRPKTAESRDRKKNYRLEQKKLKRERLEQLAFEREILERERLEQMKRDREAEIQLQASPVAIETVDKRRDEILGTKFCPECGNPLKSEDMNFCFNCGKKIKQVKPSIDTSEFLGGIMISLIGGSISILLGFGLPLVYPEIANSIGALFLILQSAMIIGGIVSIIGAFFVFYKPRLGSSVVAVGSIISGINIITIAGASRILKKLRETGWKPTKKKRPSKGISGDIHCPFCHSEVKTGQGFCDYCGNRLDTIM